MESLANHGRNQGLSFQNQGNFFSRFSKRAGRPRLSVAQNASTSLIMPNYP